MISISSKTRTTRVVSEHQFARVMLNKSSGQKALHAAIQFFPGDIICKFSAATTQDYATYLTVQLADEKHITLLPEFLQYINHSCDPSVFFDTTTMELVCLRAMKPGDEFTFFYPSTEWEMAQSFICNCGSKNCLQLITGASILSDEILEGYKLTDYIQGKLIMRQDG